MLKQAQRHLGAALTRKVRRIDARGGRVDEESDVIGTERKASGRPGDPTRSALKADRWQLGILPQAEKRAGARSGQTGIFSGYLAE